MDKVVILKDVKLYKLIEKEYILTTDKRVKSILRSKAKLRRILISINTIEEILKKRILYSLTELKLFLKDLLKSNSNYFQTGYFKFEKKKLPKRGLTIIITPTFKFRLYEKDLENLGIIDGDFNEKA